MKIPKIKRGDRLRVTLLNLEVGDAVKIPYRIYSENSIRATVSQLKLSHPVKYDINVKSNLVAIITREE